MLRHFDHQSKPPPLSVNERGGLTCVNLQDAYKRSLSWWLREMRLHAIEN